MALYRASIRSASSTCRRSTSRPACTVTPAPVAAADSQAAMSSAASAASAAETPKIVVARLDLSRVDERLAVEAEMPALFALCPEAVGVRQVRVDAVEYINTGGAGRQYAVGEGGKQSGAARLIGDAQRLAQVSRAHDDAAETRRAAGDAFDVQNAPGSFRHAPELQTVRGGAGRQHGPLPATGRPRHPPWTAGGRRRRSGLRPRRSASPHSVSSPLMRTTTSRWPNWPGGNGRDDRSAGSGLRGWQHGILQVEDQAIHRQGPGLFEGPGIAARDVEDGAAGADCEFLLHGIRQRIPEGPEQAPRS